jgi:hypothetical protein
MTVRLSAPSGSLTAPPGAQPLGDGSAHLHLWFLARPRAAATEGVSVAVGRSPRSKTSTYGGNLAMVAAWLAEFGGPPAAPPRIDTGRPGEEIDVFRRASAARAVVSMHAPGRHGAVEQATGRGRVLEAEDVDDARPVVRAGLLAHACFT